ncbi:MAG: hypothetical protein RLZZ312_360 [Bacteroidota bacterium]
MDSETHEKYEYARARIAQKKWLLYHFIFLRLAVYCFLYLILFCNLAAL